MKSLPCLLTQLLSAHRHGSDLILLFDYDGTLAPIVPHPRLARLDPHTRRLLRRLAARPRVHLGILSGRALDDLKQMVRLRRICYAGNSGLEMELCGVQFVHPRAHRARRLVAELARCLRPLVARFPGAWIENKRLGLTVHYRGVAKERVPALRELLQGALRGADDRFRVVPGPMAVEIGPNLDCTKGTAVQMIVDRVGAADDFVLYVGDGANDVEAMEVVAGFGGITVGIGPDAYPGAQHHMGDCAALVPLLAELDASLAEQGFDAAREHTDALALYGLWKQCLPTGPM